MSAPFIAFFHSVRLRVKLRLARAEVIASSDTPRFCPHSLLPWHWWHCTCPLLGENVSFHKVYGEGQAILRFNQTCYLPPSPKRTRSTWLGRAYPQSDLLGSKSLLPGSIPSAICNFPWQSLLVSRKILDGLLQKG